MLFGLLNCFHSRGNGGGGQEWGYQNVHDFLLVTLQSPDLSRHCAITRNFIFYFKKIIQITELNFLVVVRFVDSFSQSIPSEAKYFAKFDAVNGYFQKPLDEESSMLTTFILPSGRYRYLRIPQGLNASSDEWCRRSDAVVEGLLWSRKIVDDIIIWAPDMSTLQSRIEEISSRCKILNIVLSKKFFVIGSTLPFAGYIMSDQGVQPNQERVATIRHFPSRKD